MLDLSALPMPSLSAPSLLDLFVPPVPSLSVPLLLSLSVLPMLDLSAPLMSGLFAPPVTDLSAPPMPKLSSASALPLAGSFFTSTPPVPGLFALPIPEHYSMSAPPMPGSSFAFALPMPSLSALPMPVFSVFSFSALPWLSPHIPAPRKQRLIKWNQRVKKTSSSKELTPIFLLPLPFIDIKRPFFIPFSVFFPLGRSVKRLFDKAFDSDCRPLANDCSEKEVNLSFAGCQYSQAVKANRVWQ